MKRLCAHEAGFTADEISTDCTITLGLDITSSHLVLKAKVPGDKAKFDVAAADAKAIVDQQITQHQYYIGYHIAVENTTAGQNQHIKIVPL